jgi:hypothetical protein
LKRFETRVDDEKLLEQFDAIAKIHQRSRNDELNVAIKSWTDKNRKELER